MIKKASLRMQTAKVDECFNDFKQAAAIDKDNADVYHHRGQVPPLSSLSIFTYAGVEIAVGHRKYSTKMQKPPVTLKLEVLKY